MEGSYTNGQKTKIVYGVFTTPENAIGGNAICAFQISDVLDTFEGPFKEQETANSNWLPVRDMKVRGENWKIRKFSFSRELHFRFPPLALVSVPRTLNNCQSPVSASSKITVSWTRQFQHTLVAVPSSSEPILSESPSVQPSSSTLKYLSKILGQNFSNLTR